MIKNKKGFIGLLFNPIILISIILIIFVVMMFLGFSNGYRLSFVSDVKSQLMQDYTTEWASSTDSNPISTYSDSKLDCGGTAAVIGADMDLIQLGADSTTIDSYCTFKKNFYGQEVAMVVGGWDLANFEVNGDKTYVTFQDGDVFGAPKLHVLKPHTADISRVDVIRDGLVIKTIQVSNPETISFHSGVSRSKSYLNLWYLGYKPQYSCDLSPDEVWIQEAFAQPFSIKDMSFPVTKLCRETRPFVLRNIQQGETPYYPNPIPAFNRGDFIDVPAGSIGIVNYATPNVAGVTQQCGLDSANVKVAGKWICSQVIKTTTITREVPIREIIRVSGANQFTAANDFKIGSSEFTQQQKFDCEIPSDVDIVRFPQPSKDCYSSLVSYGGKSLNLNDNQLINLNDYVSVQYFAGGEVTRTKQTLQGTYIFNIANPFVINLNGGLTFKQGNKSTISLKITNALPANSIIIKTKQKVITTNQNLPEVTASINAIQGINGHSFDIDTGNLGINEITLQAFYPIDADARVIIPSDIIKINVEVRNDQQSIIKFVEVGKVEIINIGKPNFFDKMWLWIKNLFGG